MAKIFVVSSKSQVDILVYDVDHQSQAKGDVKWYYVNSKS